MVGGKRQHIQEGNKVAKRKRPKTRRNNSCWFSAEYRYK